MNSLLLFKVPKKRNYKGPAKYTQSRFDYLDCSGRKRCQNARKTLEEWFSNYKVMHPEEAKDLRNRFCSKKDEHHLAALTELYLHNVLLKNGFNEIQTHPIIKGSSVHPEFLILDKGKPLFFVEATVVFGKVRDTRADKFVNLILDAINEVSSSDFLISVDIKNINSDQIPSTKKVKNSVRSKLDSLDYDRVCEDIESTGQFPEWEYEINGWKLGFWASPVTEETRERRTDSSRNLGAIQHPVKWIGLDELIKKEVRKKLKKYKGMTVPFFVATNIINDSMFCDDETIQSALFGKEVIHVTQYIDGSHRTELGRNKDGIIIHPKYGIQYTRMSGLLTLVGLTGTTLQFAEPVLWHNPKAKYPIDPKLFKIKHKLLNSKTDKMEEFTS